MHSLVRSQAPQISFCSSGYLLVFFCIFFSFSRTFLRATCPRSRMLPVHYRKALATRFNAISRVRNLINSRCSLTVRISAPLARKFRTNVTRDKKKMRVSSPSHLCPERNSTSAFLKLQSQLRLFVLLLLWRV